LTAFSLITPPSSAYRWAESVDCSALWWCLGCEPSVYMIHLSGGVVGERRAGQHVPEASGGCQLYALQACAHQQSWRRWALITHFSLSLEGWGKTYYAVLLLPPSICANCCCLYLEGS
jgi:hypothetical protein